MKLRRLEDRDAILMLEWMHDDNIVHFMRTDFSKKTLADCEAFIHLCQTDENNVHKAIVDDDDIYMGTVSLKNIDSDKHNAEFAIVIRKDAMGKGFSKFGMDEIIRYGFGKLNLDTIYWYVNRKNQRAIRFYDKNGYHEKNLPLGENYNSSMYRWYTIKRTDTLQSWKIEN